MYFASHKITATFILSILLLLSLSLVLSVPEERQSHSFILSRQDDTNNVRRHLPKVKKGKSRKLKKNKKKAKKKKVKKIKKKSSKALFVFCDIGDDELGFINIRTDTLIQVNVQSIEDWPYPDEDGIMQHAWLDKSGTRIHISTVARETEVAAGIVTLTHSGIDWESGDVMNLKVLKFVEVADPGSITSYPQPCEEEEPSSENCPDGSIYQVNLEQPIVGWQFLPFTQIHGPTIRPKHRHLSYCGTVTDDQMIVMNTKNDLNTISSYSFPGFSNYSHGFFFNKKGNRALNAGYFYDSTHISLFKFAKDKEEPIEIHSIPLGANNVLGALTHYVAWIDERFAYTATMQFAPTSVTEAGITIEPPGIYLIDTDLFVANRIVGTAYTPDASGVYRSASDIIIANGKVYVLEEDTLGTEFGRDGSISIFNIVGGMFLDFKKRISPGEDGLPEDFSVAHGGVLSHDKKYLLVLSYASNYIVKLDTMKDEVVKVWGKEDGLNAPHGGFLAGNYR